MQLLGLEVQLATGQCVEAARAQHRRDVGMGRDARGGGKDGVEVGKQCVGLQGVAGGVIVHVSMLARHLPLEQGRRQRTRRAQRGKNTPSSR